MPTMTPTTPEYKYQLVLCQRNKRIFDRTSSVCPYCGEILHDRAKDLMHPASNSYIELKNIRQEGKV